DYSYGEDFSVSFEGSYIGPDQLEEGDILSLQLIDNEIEDASIITEETEEKSVSGTKLNMTGDVGDFNPSENIDDPTHDPALIEHDGTYYVFSTGISRSEEDPGGIYVRKSEENLGGEWESMGEIEVPDWVMNYDWLENEGNPTHLWAPAVTEKDGTVYLYYAASQFGTNQSAIGVASTDDPSSLESWEDHGTVVESEEGDDYNAIDGSPVYADGQWWLTFGSHWEGVKLQALNDNMTEVEGEMHWLQDRNYEINAVEAPNIIERDGYYYLFTSWDTCCAGTDSTYKIAVGRSDSITGPYEDRDGTPLKGENDIQNGGTIILDTEDNQIG
ncbi:arabinan endo-1,5-alpha-L-arabinosidase, partial [Salibacterium salarium]